VQPRMGFEKSLKTDQFQSITRLDRRIESWAAHPVPREPTVQRRVQRRLTIGPGGDGVGDTSVPKQPTSRVVHEVTTIDEIHRLADVDARRPARNVTGDAYRRSTWFALRLPQDLTAEYRVSGQTPTTYVGH
jgi:hypothetical protein